MHAFRTVSAAAMVAAALALAAAPATAGDRRKSPDGRVDPALLYHNYCSVCHGDQGDGRSRARNSLVPPPANFTDPALRARLTVDYIAAITREGKPGTAMVGWKTQLDAAESKALARYVRTQFVEKSGTDAARRGRTLFGHYCVACHGPTGRGIEAGSAAREGVKPGPDLSRVAALSRERVIAAIAVGRSSAGKPGFAQQMAPADIEAVADYLQSLLATAPGVSGTSAHGGKASDAKR